MATFANTSFFYPVLQCEYGKSFTFITVIDVSFQVTWADLHAAVGMHTLVMVGLEAELDKYPKLKAHRDRIQELPQIAAWLKKRPDTPF